MGGLEAVHAIKTLRPERVDQPSMSSLVEQVKYYLWRYSLGDIHDPPLNLLWPDGESSSLDADEQVADQDTRGDLLRSKPRHRSALQPYPRHQADLAIRRRPRIFWVICLLERRSCAR
ncbi:glucosyltransferase [Fusarium falciforme]|nr:glucosyltransferase [Fusarium falciforme]